MKPELWSVVAEVAAVRGELDGAAQVTQVLADELLLVEEWRDGWARVRTVYDYPAGPHGGPPRS